MDRVIEFSINHWQLVLTFLSLCGLLFWWESKKAGKTVSPQMLVDLANRSDAMIFDVRDAKEFRTGHITGSVNIPFADIKKRIEELKKHKEKPVILVCKMGQHSGTVGKLFTQAGFQNVMRLSGGIIAWQNSSFPLVKN